MQSDSNTVRVITIPDYIGPLFLFGLFVEKDNEDVRFHTNQGLILFLLDVAAGIVGGIVSALPGLVGSLLSGLLSLVCLAVVILGIINAVNGQRRPLPIIGALFTFIK